MSKKWKRVFIVLAVMVILGMGGSVAALQYFKQPQSCATCHLMESHVESYLEPDLLAYAHAQAEEVVVCLDCHKYTIFEKVGEIVTFVRGQYSDPLEEIEYPTDNLCVACHLIQELGRAIEAMEIESHDSLHYDARLCSRCHKMHREQVKYCIDCHEPGEGGEWVEPDLGD